MPNWKKVIVPSLKASRCAQLESKSMCPASIQQSAQYRRQSVCPISKQVSVSYLTLLTLFLVSPGGSQSRADPQRHDGAQEADVSLRSRHDPAVWRSPSPVPGGALPGDLQREEGRLPCHLHDEGKGRKGEEIDCAFVC